MQFTLPLLTLLLASASALAEPLSQNAAARAALVARETGVFAPQYGLARRSLELTGGRKMHARRRPSTAAQREAQAKLNAYADNQAAINTKWQAAAMESLKAGKTPQTFDEFANGQAAGSASASTPAPAADTSSNDDSNDDESDKSDDNDDEQAAVSNSNASADDCDTDASGQEDSKPAAAAAPVVKAKEKPAPKQDAQPKQEAPKQEAPKQEAPKQDTPKQTSNNNNSNSGASNSGGSGDKTGEMTYYATGLGACGWTNNDSDFITAVSASLYDSFGLSNGSKVCGRKVKIFYGGKSITATVADRCVGCAQNDLDLSPSAFSALANQDIGRTKMTWTWA